MPNHFVARAAQSAHRRLSRAALLALCVTAPLASLTAPAWAVPLQARPAMEQALKQPPQPVKVIEPHLSTRTQNTEVTYLGWPAPLVLDTVLGADWRKPGVDVEFRALDGYVSRIPADKFSQHRAYLVVQRVGHPDFSVNNLAQNEKNVPLGPYYLVWDNIRSPELLADGGNGWPYQVAEIKISEARSQALLPAHLPAGLRAVATEAQTHCLSCHQINGFGGDKWPGNLAQQARALGEPAFLRWVLAPDSVKPGTTMPPVAKLWPDAEREALASRLLDYLRAVGAPAN
ncbi:MAG: hypothetical protein U1D28_07915 [Burkholderiales bacterium]|nr:hypothetical protein [Burkholderiales bacterium]